MEPPAYLSNEAREFWAKNFSELRNSGLVDTLSAPLFVALCSVYGDFRQASVALQSEPLIRPDRDGTMRKNPWYTVQARASVQLLRLLSEFGMTPASRARLFGRRDE
jgi:P27 family predicted phage terminase small subunit